MTSSDELWRWCVRGLLGAVGIVERHNSDTLAPPNAIKDLEQARGQIDTILRQQQKKREANQESND